MRKFLFFACIVVGVLLSCNGDDGTLFVEDETNSSHEMKNVDGLINTIWKFYGFGSVDKKEIREVKPSVKEDAYMITFHDDGSVSGSTSINDFFAEYFLLGDTIFIKDFRGSKAGEIGDGKEYCTALQSCSRYLVLNNQLLLFYNF